MNILVDNYVTAFSTEAIYLYHTIDNTEGLNAFYWPNKNISTYDIFDETNPDVFITHVGHVNFELASYITDNKSDMIVLLSTEDYPQDKLLEVQTVLLEHDKSLLNNLFFLNRKHNPQKTKIKSVVLSPCADINIPEATVEYNIPKAYVVSAGAKLEKHEGSYHYLSNDNREACIAAPQQNLASIMSKYDEIEFSNMPSFRQAFYDAAFRCNKVYYSSDNKKLDEQSEKIFGQVLSKENKENVDYEEVKKVIAEKHAPRNRVKSLLSQLPINHQLFTEV